MSQNPPDNLVTVTIDGKVARVPKGTILVDAAATVGVEIPIFCYHPKMKPVGACRMCMVQIAPTPRLTTACTTPVADGMVVTTRSEMIDEARESVLGFLLANHPLDCPVCDKGGECPLQDNTFGYGPATSQFIESKRRYEKPVDLSPLIKLDRERCILCYRCTRFATEIAGDESLTVLERGSSSEIGLAPGRTFDSPFSGNTIELCPVGALTSSLYRFRARPWDLNSIPSVCPHCSMGCNINVHMRKTVEEVVRFLSRENAAVDDGWLCDFGRFNYDYINSDKRLTQPLIRRGGQLVPATWEEALELVAARLSAIAGEHGPETVGGIGSTTLTNEELYLFQKLLRLGLHTPNVDHRVDGAVYTAAFEHDAGMVAIEALERAGAILLVGIDPTVETPVLDLRLKKAVAKGVPLIVVNSQPIDLAAHTRLRLQPKPGTEAMVVAALLKIIMDAGQTAEGFAPTPALREAVAGLSLDELAQATGVSTEDLTSVAQLYAAAGAGRGAILYRRDDTALPGGQELLDFLTTLAQATGSTGENELGLHGLVLDSNEQGAIDMGLLPTRLPGQRPLDSIEAREELERLWGAPLPAGSGLNGAEMLEAAAAGRLRALYLLTCTPRGAARNAAAFQAALERVEFLVVQDIELTDLMAAHADVVLPGAAFIEKEGTLTNLERRVQRIRIGRRTPGDARPDWRILRDLGALIAGQPAFNHLTPRETMTELVQAAPIYAGLTYGRIGQRGLRWPTNLPPAGEPALVATARIAPQG